MDAAEYKQYLFDEEYKIHEKDEKANSTIKAMLLFLVTISVIVTVLIMIIVHNRVVMRT
jgi:hypothetical protein